MRRHLIVALVGSMALAPTAVAQRGDTLFTDTFDRGLARWETGGAGGSSAVSILRTDSPRGNVLRLAANGDAHALLRGSAAWPGVAIEGEVQFPQPGDSYLGVVYNARQVRQRWDFGLIYLKFGRRVYLQANPHRDYNVTRTFYPEYEVSLEAGAVPKVGEWVRFRVEVVDGRAHFYVRDLTAPVMTFPIAEPGPGALGFQPRSVGEEIWLDNIVVRRISEFSYRGANRPDPSLAGTRWNLNSWELLGPLRNTRDEVAGDTLSGRGGWKPFALDPRGAIASGRVVDFHGPGTVAYFRTTWQADSAGSAVLHLSSVDDVAVWQNGRFVGFIGRGAAAWFDAGTNPVHAAEQVRLATRRGKNVLVLRIRGGTYAAGGLYARVEP